MIFVKQLRHFFGQESFIVRKSRNIFHQTFAFLVMKSASLTYKKYVRNSPEFQKRGIIIILLPLPDQGFEDDGIGTLG